MGVAPAEAGVDAGVVLEVDGARGGGPGPVPVFEGVLGIPDDVVAVSEVDLGVAVPALVGQRGVVDFPDAAAFDEVVVGVFPELDAVAKAHGPAIRPRELMAAADPGDVTVTDNDVVGAAAADAMSGAVEQRQVLIHDVALAALVNDVAPQGQLMLRWSWAGFFPIQLHLPCVAA